MSMYMYVYIHVLSHFSHVQLFGTPRTGARAPVSMGISRQEYWSGLPFPSTMFVCVCVCMHIYAYIY